VRFAKPGTAFASPESDGELARLIAEAMQVGVPLDVRGNGTKEDVGRPVQAAGVISTENMAGVTLYEPTELVLSAKAGTPLNEVEQTLAERGQELPFEPIDLGPALGRNAGEGTIGAVFATNLSGSRRLLSGSARDHCLGIKGVSGRGEAFKSGGRVMKNVTGYDLSKGLSGSWGTLAVITEVTMKVLPVREEARTLLFFGLIDEAAVEAMLAAVATPFEISGAVHLHANFAAKLVDADIRKQGRSVTAIRIENFASSVRYRTSKLKDRLAGYNPELELNDERSRSFWRQIRELKFLQGSNRPAWRISTRPATAAKLVTEIRRSLRVDIGYDWAGGLIWVETESLSDAGVVEIRRALAEFGGHATLIRAEPATRAAVDVFQPLSPQLMKLTRELKAAFDPAGILNPGRMYAAV
jgi:glycolate oxidase FAD binding subunit